MSQSPTTRNNDRKDHFPDGTMMTEIVVAVVILGVITAIAAPRLFGAIPF
ncbi:MULTISPECIES: hypothetical protein [Pirellulaceae]|uniref:Tfp pilus assembly protein FimT n=1 Tax=Aporhodopirellula rubra TaxID=980271 RepID=A0A7W5E3V1_9BACT|nr:MULTISPECIES: hypothetical protein [Pirellulaceae]EMI46372.1 hypothetical protein RRSWK_01109 [Rhodopirellula sp. SWK7]MBB3209720.1 Tfp pilus assembly protein FimT [Aporhodopirellula rubra]